jgi:hypothetical protein
LMNPGVAAASSASSSARSLPSISWCPGIHTIAIFVCRSVRKVEAVF